jgi:hypothetical protein
MREQGTRGETEGPSVTYAPQAADPSARRIRGECPADVLAAVLAAPVDRSERGRPRPPDALHEPNVVSAVDALVLAGRLEARVAGNEPASPWPVTATPPGLRPPVTQPDWVTRFGVALETRRFTQRCPDRYRRSKTPNRRRAAEPTRGETEGHRATEPNHERRAPSAESRRLRSAGWLILSPPSRPPSRTPWWSAETTRRTAWGSRPSPVGRRNDLEQAFVRRPTGSPSILIVIRMAFRSTVGQAAALRVMNTVVEASKRPTVRRRHFWCVCV